MGTGVGLFVKSGFIYIDFGEEASRRGIRLFGGSELCGERSRIDDRDEKRNALVFED